MSGLTGRQLYYRRYLESDHWRQLRVEAFKAYGRKCQRCPARFALEVHHVIYRHPWELGQVRDLMILCRPCHQREHARPRVISKPEHRRYKPGRWNEIKRGRAAKSRRQFKKKRAAFAERKRRLGWSF